MLLKRIEGKSLPETLERVRAECGRDALIVETRATHNGYLVVAARRESAIKGRDQAGRSRRLSKWTQGFSELAEKATDFGLSAAIIGAVERALLGTRVDLSRPGDPALPNIASRVLASLVRTTDVIEGDVIEARQEDGQSECCRGLALVGPTGVGKTTTLAKLAARARGRGERVAIVTIDTYRVAAVEQLRAFADLMAVPFTVAFTASDLRRAMRENADCDRIYVDTSGRSPRDTAALPMLEGYLRAGECSTILCLAAGTHRRDSELVLDAFEPLGISAVCLSKWDETVMPGESVSAVVERGLPLSHLCIGQEVPADIITADAAAIAAAAFDIETAGAPA